MALVERYPGRSVSVMVYVPVMSIRNVYCPHWLVVLVEGTGVPSMVLIETVTPLKPGSVKSRAALTFWSSNTVPKMDEPKAVSLRSPKLTT